MILWFENLPKKDIDFSKWIPFIKNEWLRKNYMKFVYLLMGVLFIVPSLFESNFYNKQIKNTFADCIANSIIGYFISWFYVVLIIEIIFILHELLHIAVVYNMDDISLTHSGVFFWINTNAILSKMQFWLFMTLPIIGLSVVPFIISLFINGYIKFLMVFICWVNLIIASSDIINSILILIKPNNTLFCRGYYRAK